MKLDNIINHIIKLDICYYNQMNQEYPYLAGFEEENR